MENEDEAGHDNEDEENNEQEDDDRKARGNSREGRDSNDAEDENDENDEGGDEEEEEEPLEPKARSMDSRVTPVALPANVSEVRAAASEEPSRCVFVRGVDKGSDDADVAGRIALLAGLKDASSVLFAQERQGRQLQRMAGYGIAVLPTPTAAAAASARATDLSVAAARVAAAKG